MDPHVRFIFSNHPKHEEKLNIPLEMGEPIVGHHLTSTPHDNLIELAGRVCYDSMVPKSRNSTDYHKHIIEVQHTSVWDHVVFNMDIDPALCYAADTNFEAICTIMAHCANRPGVYTRYIPERWARDGLEAWTYKQRASIRVTLNLRALREWSKFNPEVLLLDKTSADALQETFRQHAKRKCPLAMQDFQPSRERDGHIQPVAPSHPEEIYITLFFTRVSRGLSHELVRHRHMAGISQRSTRYCDESESNWCVHPLMRGLPESQEAFDTVLSIAKGGYKVVNNEVKAALLAKGADKFTALKQARGAARGLLGNALETELVYTTNLAQWKRMIAQRANPAADAEIRETFEEVKALLTSEFPEHF